MGDEQLMLEVAASWGSDCKVQLRTVPGAVVDVLVTRQWTTQLPLVATVSTCLGSLCKVTLKLEIRL